VATVNDGPHVLPSRVVALIAAVVFASCTSVGNQGPPSPTAADMTSRAPATPSPAPIVPALARTFQSNVYGYTIDHPATWRARSATRGLVGLEPPWVDGEAVDQLAAQADFAAAGPPGTIVIGSGRLPAGADLASWTDGTAVELCGTPEAREPFPVDGQAGQLLTYPSCKGLFHQWLTFTTADLGWHVVWIDEPGRAAFDRELFEAIVGTLRLDSGAAGPRPSRS
jgi:hypothetical protein